MENFTDLLHTFFPLLVILYFFYLLRRIIKWINNSVEKAEVHKDELLNVLEEIRDELKELNKKNSNK